MPGIRDRDITGSKSSPVRRLAPACNAMHVQGNRFVEFDLAVIDQRVSTGKTSPTGRRGRRF